MRNPIEFIGIDGCRFTLDNDSISGVIEIKDAIVKDEQNRIIKIPDHTQIVMGGFNFKAKGTYDEIMNSIKEQDYNNNLGICK